MRCPKCHYLSFDPEPRCKNCGYDLEVADTELKLRTVEAPETVEPDLELRGRDAAGPPVTLELVRPVREPEPELVGVSAAPAPKLTSAPAFVPAPAPQARPIPVAPPAVQDRPIAAPVRAPHTTTELPLFVKDISQRTPPPDDDPAAPAPLIEVPAAPRPPLSVRRPVADSPKVAPRLERRVGPLDHDLLEDLRRVEMEEVAQRRAEARARAEVRSAAAEEASASVQVSQRLGAAAFDGLLLGGIGAFVLWATLRLCDVGPLDLGVASLVPLAVFLGAVGVAYLVMFTVAGGQTVGKMLMGIRVVGDAEAVGDERLTIGQAAGRAVLVVVSVSAFGLGWLPALFGRHLALHDRLARTRVVRA